jgi:hypothetical protein
MYPGLQEFTQAQQILLFLPGGTDTITFSTAVTNPILAIQNRNATNSDPATLTFSATDEITGSAESELNLAGDLTGCSIATSACTITIPGNVEPTDGTGGIVEVLGTDITSISWTISPGADVGFTVGTVVPEPDSFVLLATVLLAMVLLKLHGRISRGIAPPAMCKRA